MFSMATKAQHKSSPSIIVDGELYQALIDENQALRDKLAQVSSVGISAMFHTHRGEAESYSRAVLKGAAELMNRVKIEDIHKVYEQGYQLASAPSVLEQFQYPHLKG